MMKKRMIAFMLGAMMAVSLLTGCAGSDGQKNGNSSNKEGVYTVGISQFSEHGSLDNCREGFLAGLEEAGFTEGENLEVIYENAQADTGAAATIAESFRSQHVNLVCAIATPAAAAAYNACMDTEIPVIYTAISDPKSAGLADETGKSTGNITGTSDLLPVSEQLNMIRTMMPDAKKIGILYTTSEANSISTIATYKELAGEYGFEIVDSGISVVSEVEMAAADLAGKVDCICNLTDNTVVQALQVVLAQAEAAKIPVFGSEIEQVKNGCVASMGIDYVEVGKVTGKMAAEVLKGESEASEMNFKTAEKAELYVNTAAAAQIGMTLDEAYIRDAAEVFDEIVIE